MGLAAPSGLVFKELVHVERLVSFEHIIGGPSDFMSEDGEGLGLAVLSLESFLELETLGVTPEEKNGGFGESPLEVSVADFLAGVTMALSG